MAGVPSDGVEELPAHDLHPRDEAAHRLDVLLEQPGVVGRLVELSGVQRGLQPTMVPYMLVFLGTFAVLLFGFALLGLPFGPGVTVGLPG
jgi:hypothetical protein